MGQLRRLRPGTVAVLAGLCAALPVVPAARAAPVPPSLAAHDAGIWDLSFEKGNRRCRLVLRGEAVGGGFAVAMPAGCHKAFPTIAAVTGWTPGEGGHILFNDEAEFAIFDFAPVTGLPSLSATAGEGDEYTLTPADPARQDELRAGGPEVVAASDKPAAAPLPASAGGVLVEKGGGAKPRSQVKAEPGPGPSLPPPTMLEVAGNYAVLRQDRDTGCMVTLEPGVRSKTGLRARLAPACRDQGIVIFDPVGWDLGRGSELVLTARKGHSTALVRRDGKTWSNSPPRGAPLVLKRL